MDNFNARVIRPALSAAGVAWYGWHALRRGLASNLVELRVDPKIAQAILRHANVRTTTDFYIKARPEKTAAAMSQLEATFKKRQEAFEQKLKAM